MTITKKTVNGKEQITSCTLATCCLTVERINDVEIKLSNEKNQTLICTLEELEEISSYLKEKGLNYYW